MLNITAFKCGIFYPKPCLFVCLFVKDGFMSRLISCNIKQRAPLIRIFLRPKTIYCFQLSDVVREDKRCARDTFPEKPNL